MDLQFASVADTGTVTPIEAHVCDVVLDDVVQSQVPRLELLLEHLGYQVYSSADDGEEGERSRRSSSAASVRSGDRASLPPESDQTRLQHAFNELLTTERSYVRRIEALHNHYAVPLRQFAQDKDTEIIPAREAEQMFINLNDIVTANKMLLCELEGLSDQGIASVAAHIGDVLAESFSNFQSYDEYLGTYEEAKNVYNNMLKRRSFREYIEYSLKDLGNSGLRELMMEPLQRLPRYQLLIGNLLKYLPESAQTHRLRDASDVAGKIASREFSVSTRRTAVLRSCCRHIEGFPAELVSPRRDLLGCLDVEDPDAASAQPTNMLTTIGTALIGGRRRRSASRSSLFSLLVFSDCLVLVQRASGVSAHQVLGVRDLQKLASTVHAPADAKKVLHFAGAMAYHEFTATAPSEDLMELRPTGSEGVRRFSDAQDLPSAASEGLPSRIVQFLDCLWRAQAMSEAAGSALQVRTILAPANEYRGTCHMFWIVRTLSQYQRLEQRDHVMVHIGTLPAAERLQREYNVETFFNLDLHENTPTASVVISKGYGAERQMVDVFLSDIVGQCADLCMRSLIPAGAQPAPEEQDEQEKQQEQEEPEPEPEVPERVELPVRRAASARMPRERHAPMQVQRARSLMSQRVRASIQSSLQAVQEEEGGRKRHTPLADMTNSPTKRRAVQTLEDKGKQREVDTMPEAEEADGGHRQQASFRADETLDLPNPFDMLYRPQEPETPVAEVHGEAREAPEAEELPQEPAAEPEALPEAAQEAVPEEAAPEPEAAEAAEQPQEQGVEERIPEPAAEPEPMSEDAPVNDVAKPEDEAQPPEPIKSEMPPPVPTKTSMIDLVPRRQVSFAEPPRRRKRTAAMTKSMTIGDFELPEMEQQAPKPLYAEELFDMVVGDTVPDDVGASMRQAIKDVNERIAMLRRYRPKVHNPNWLNDWIGFKNAAKTLNTRWTQMERAYENNQMRLASLELSQGEYDNRVRLTQEELARIQDEANMVVPLRVQIEQLTQKCEALSDLERDVRLENAELYEAFNEELDKLYQHTFRPADEEIYVLRQKLVEANDEMNRLRAENRALQRRAC